MAWFYLGLAIFFEVAGTYFLKLSNGFEKWLWGGMAFVCYGLCLLALAPAMKLVPVGVVYAIWAGVGILAASAIGFFAFAEKLSAYQLVFISFILVGAVGLNLTTKGLG